MRAAICLIIFLLAGDPAAAYDRLFNYLGDRYLRQMEDQDRLRQLEIERLEFEALRRRQLRRSGEDDEVVDTRPRRRAVEDPPRPLVCDFVMPGHMVCR